MMQPELKVREAQLCLIIGAIGMTLAVNTIILLSPTQEGKNIFGNLLRPILTGGAMSLAIYIVARQKLKGRFGKAYAGIAAGLVLYFIAAVIWAGYSLTSKMAVPFPSLADAFWLAAYAPFGFGIFTLSRLYKNKNRAKSMVIYTLVGAALVGLYIHQLIAATDMKAANAMSTLAVTLAYPILDVILIVPALMALLSSGKGYLTAVPWIFISWIFAVIADTIFGFSAVSGTHSMNPTWNLFYNAEYITMAAGMLWYSSYMFLDKKRFAALKATEQ